MSVVLYTGGRAVGYFDKFAGTSPYAGAYRGAKLGKWWGDKVKAMGRASSNYRSRPYGNMKLPKTGYGSVPFPVTGSARGRLTGSAPSNPATALRIMGDLPSSNVHRRKTSRIY